MPLDAVVKNEDGKMVKLGDYFNTGRPVILAFVYYECPMLCNEVLNGLTGSLKGINLTPAKIMMFWRSALMLAKMTSPTWPKTKRPITSNVMAGPGQKMDGTF